jgi:two-component system, NarL family, nitrate/nitrite response regulator NarL
MNEATHVSIVSDNELSREGLKGLMRASSLSASCTASVDVASLPPELDSPQHLILVEGDDEGKMRAIALSLRPIFPQSKIALMCGEFSLGFVKDSIVQGISGLLSKDIGFSALLRQFQLILSGEKVLPTRAIEHLVDADTLATPGDWSEHAYGRKLSERENVILRCLVDGDANKVISRRLNIAEPTVKVHIKAILRKLRVDNRTQAAVWAMSKRARADLHLH